MRSLAILVSREEGCFLIVLYLNLSTADEAKIYRTFGDLCIKKQDLTFSCSPGFQRTR